MVGLGGLALCVLKANLCTQIGQILPPTICFLTVQIFDFFSITFTFLSLDFSKLGNFNVP